MGAFLLKLALGGLNILKILGSLLKRFFSALDVQGWIGLGVSLVLGVYALGQHGEARHWKKQSGQYETLYRGELAHEERIAKQALELKTKIDALTANISSTMKEWNDAENRRVTGAADALRVRGPGKAVCPGYSGPAASAGGHQPPGGNGDAAGPAVPAADRAAVPWPWLVDRAEQADLNRAEVLTWREWYRRLVAAWPKPKG